MRTTTIRLVLGNAHETRTLRLLSIGPLRRRCYCLSSMSTGLKSKHLLRTVGVSNWFVHCNKLLGFTLDFDVVINGRDQRRDEEGAAGILDEGSEKANYRGVTGGGS